MLQSGKRKLKLESVNAQELVRLEFRESEKYNRTEVQIPALSFRDLLRQDLLIPTWSNR